jgi:hypothetical protein
MGDGHAHQASSLRARFNEKLASLETSLENPPEPTTPKRDSAPARPKATIPPNLDILPARVSSEPFLGQTTTLRDLCSVAGIPYRYIGGNLPYIGFSRGSGNLRAIDAKNHRVLVVDLAQLAATTRDEQAIRIIEVLAHSFHEYAARECARGLFGLPKTSSLTGGPPAQSDARQREREA